MTEKIKSIRWYNVRKYKPVHTVPESFNAIMGKTTEMFQRKKKLARVQQAGMRPGGLTATNESERSGMFQP